MDIRIESMMTDQLTNAGGMAGHKTGMQAIPSTRLPVDLRGSLSALYNSISLNGPIRFVGHFLEMVFSMMVGMPVLGMISAALAPTFPVLRAPTVYTVLMGIFMTVPMVAWMHFRGHTWRQAAEMSAAMLVPSGALLAVGMSGPAHLAMILGMLGIMLYRRDEYLNGHCHDLSQMRDAS